MAIETTKKIGVMEVVGDYKHIQVRTDTIVTEDGVEISKSYHRHVLQPHMDISGEDTEVQNIANSVWTDKIKTDWNTFLQNMKPLGD